MATENEKASSTKKAGSTKGPAKKKMILPGDPPIIVGGGGSTLVFIPKGTAKVTLTKIPNYIGNIDDYDCYEVDVEIVLVDARDGKGGSCKVKNLDKKEHSTRFLDT